MRFFLDDDNFEPDLAGRAANKWEGEDEDDEVKVRFIPTPRL